MTLETARELRDTIFSGLIEQLFTMRMRGGDRDVRTDWMPYDDFGEFYAEWSKRPLPRFDDTNVLLRMTFEVYVMRQLRDQLATQITLGGANDYDSVQLMVRLIVEENFAAIRNHLEGGDSRRALVEMLAGNDTAQPLLLPKA